MAAIDELNRSISRLLNSLNIRSNAVSTLTSASISPERTRLDAAARRTEQDRIETLRIENQLLQRNSLLARTNFINRGYEIMTARPGVFSNATQAAKWERRLEAIRNPERAKLRALREEFGNVGGTELYNAERRTRGDRNWARSRMSEYERRIFDRSEFFGGGDLGRSRAEQEYQEEEQARHHYSMSHIMWGKRRDVLRKKRQGDINWVNSRMSDYDRQMLERAEYFGGGPEGRVRAEQEYQEETQRRLSRAQARHSIRERQARLDAFREFRWLRPIARNIPAVGRNLPVIAKTLQKASHVPIVGKFVRHPALAPLAIGGYAMSQWSSALNSVLANENVRTVYGTPSQSMYGAASAVGMGFKEASKLSGTTRSFLGRLRTSSEGWEKMASAAVYGFDVRKISPNMTDDEFLKELYRQTSTMSESDRLNTLNAIGMPENAYLVGQGLTLPRSQRTSEQLNTEWIQKQITARDYKLAHGSRLEKLWAYLSPDWGFRAEAFLMPDKLLQMDLDARDRMSSGESAFSAFFNTLKAAFSADEYRSNAGAYGAGNINVSIQTLQTNASTYKDLMTDILYIGITDPSTRKAIVDSFDPLGE